MAIHPTHPEPCGYYLEGHGNLVSGFIIGITGVIPWPIGVVNYLLSPHDPRSEGMGLGLRVQGLELVYWGLL